MSRGIRIAFVVTQFATLTAATGRFNVAPSAATLTYRPILPFNGRVNFGYSTGQSWVGSDNGADWTYVDRGLEYATTPDVAPPGTVARWLSPGGDYLDTNGVVNGPSHHVTQVVNVNGATNFDISGIDGDVLLLNASRVLSATIDGNPAQAFWTDPSANHAFRVQDLSNGSNHPVIVLNPLRGSVLQLTWAGATSFPRTITLDPVGGPVVVDYPMTGPSNTPNVFDLDFTDEPTFTAMIHNYAAPLYFNPQYLVEPDTGLHYLQVTTDSANPIDSRLIKCFIAIPPARDYFFRYCVWIGPDVKNNMATAGMKMSGIGHNEDDGSGVLVSIGEHGTICPANPGLYMLRFYGYDDVVQQEVVAAGAILREETWYCIEQQFTLNTPGNADGAIRMWLNGNLIREVTGRTPLTSGDSRLLDRISVQLYHGGQEHPAGQLTYRYARMACSTSYIGLPPEFVQSQTPALPLWRQGLAVNQWTEIQGSSMAANPPTVNGGDGGGAGKAGILNTWTGVSIDTRSSTIWSLASGGHTDYYGNQVMSLDLSQDAPKWHENCPSDAAGSFAIPNNAAYYSNGHPASCHSYYCQQFIERRNRAMRFGATAWASLGNSGPKVDGFDCTVNSGFGWDAPGTYPDVIPFQSVYVTADQSMAKDPTTEDVYLFQQNYQVVKWTQASNTWSIHNTQNPPISAQACGMAFDSKRGRIFIFKGTTAHHTYDVTTGKFTAQTLTGDTATVTVSTNGVGMVYEPVMDAYIVKLGPMGGPVSPGGVVYAIDAGTFAVTALTTAGGDSLPQTARTSGNIDNVYNKWQYVPNLGGIVFIPSYAANAWFLRTH